MDEFNYNKIPPGFLTTEQAKKLIGVTDYCLRNWANEGKISFTRNESARSHRRYDVRGYFISIGKIKPEEPKAIDRKFIVYARVSSRSQEPELKNQIEFLRAKYPKYEPITDIGSGLNFSRRGFNTILEYACSGILEEVVVTYKDRLCRWGFDLLQEIFQRVSKAKIVVLTVPKTSSEQELCEDIISIITVFTARLHGKRGYGKHRGKRKTLQDDKTKIATEFKTEN